MIDHVLERYNNAAFFFVTQSTYLSRKARLKDALKFSTDAKSENHDNYDATGRYF